MVKMANLTTVIDENFSNITSNVSSYRESSKVERIVDASVLTLIAVTGTLGNLLVIVTRVHGGRLFKHGNIFILNLALVDLIVTGIFIPIIIANVITNTNVLSDVMCTVMSYSLGVSLLCSANNMTSVAINRYRCIVRPQTHTAVFIRRTLCIAVLLNWIWACMLYLPKFLGWGNIRFSKNRDMCGLNNEESTLYNIVVVMLGLVLPIGIIVVCYWKIFRKVAETEQKIRSMQSSYNHPERLVKRKQLKKQRMLAKTLLVTVLVYISCWTPYGILAIAKQDPSLFHKITTRLLLSNSMMNFIIYGVMNSKFRRENLHNSNNTKRTSENNTSVLSIQKQGQDG